VRVGLKAIDTMTLEVHASLIARIDSEQPGAESGDTDDEEAGAAVALQLAIDVADADAPVSANDGSTAATG
jgi:hypothetical protein